MRMLFQKPTNLWPFLLLCFLLTGCATTQNAPVDPGAITAHLEERLTIDQARQQILSPLESEIEKINTRLTQNLSVPLREQLLTDRELLEKQLGRQRKTFEEKTARYNPATDQIWSYRTPAGESGIVLLRDKETIYLSRSTFD
jgi:hypothetical protein